MLSVEEKMQLTIDYVKELAVEYETFTGVIVFHKDQVIAKTITSISKDNDPLAHAELKALNYVNKRYGNIIHEVELYTTQKPCPMCASAIVWSGIKQVYFGLSTNHQWETEKEIYDFFNKYGVSCKGNILDDQIKKIDDYLISKGI